MESAEHVDDSTSRLAEITGSIDRLFERLNLLDPRHFRKICIGVVFLILAVIVIITFTKSSSTHNDSTHDGATPLDESVRRASSLFSGNPRLRLPPMARLSQWEGVDRSVDLFGRRYGAITFHGTRVETATLRRIAPNAVRLPRNVLPLNYKLDIEPSFNLDGNENDTDSYRGRVAILVECQKETNEIVLHASNLDISKNLIKVEAVSRAGQPAANNISVKQISLDNDTDFLRIGLSSQLTAKSSYLLSIDFNGSLERDRAFYRYHYEDLGRPQHLLVTFFEPLFAREAFPCFDEPDLKATFEVSLTRPRQYFSVSTMPKKKSIPRADGQMVTDVFEKTPKMSTYTLSFMITNYTAQTIDRVTLYCSAQDAPFMNYALSMAPKLLATFENMLDMKYPLKKLDMVSVPAFLADAMENWGMMVFYRSSIIHGGPDLGAQQRDYGAIASVVAHEISHQWFGNLVTMGWWNDVWLNEGFAAYMQYLGVDAIAPEWNVMDSFVAVESIPTMKAELEASNPRPISPRDDDPNINVNALFDRITYSKGSVVVRMMEHFLTTPVFLKGVRAYLKHKAFGNSHEDDLFDELTEAQPSSGKRVDVKAVMSMWTRQSSFPLVTIHRNYTDGTILVSQTRHPSYHKTNQSVSPLWHIPLTFTNVDQLDFNRTWDVSWLTSRSATFEGFPKDNNKWIIANLQGIGYYRVNYDPTNWKLLSDQLNTKPSVIHPINRAWLSNDVMQLARTGVVSYETALNLVHYITVESHFMPWKSFLSNLEFLDERLQRTSFYAKWTRYMRHQIRGIYDHYFKKQAAAGTFGEKPFMKQLLSWACHYGNPDCVLEARRRISSYVNRSRNLLTELRLEDENVISTLLCTSVRHGDVSDWMFLQSQLDAVKSAEPAKILVSALGCTRDPANVKELLSAAVSDPNLVNTATIFPSSRIAKWINNNVPSARQSYRLRGSSDDERITSDAIISSLVEPSQPQKSRLVLDFLLSNWNKLVARCADDVVLQDAIVQAVYTATNDQQLQTVHQFFTKFLTDNARKMRKFKTTLDEAVSEAADVLKWIKTQGPIIESFLEKKLGIMT